MEKNKPQEVPSLKMAWFECCVLRNTGKALLAESRVLRGALHSDEAWTAGLEAIRAGTAVFINAVHHHLGPHVKVHWTVFGCTVNGTEYMSDEPI